MKHDPIDPMDLIIDQYRTLRQRLLSSSDSVERQRLQKRIRNIAGVRRFLRSHPAPPPVLERPATSLPRLS